MIASRTGDGTSQSRRPPVKLPTIDLSTICPAETAVLAQDGEAAIASVTGEADDHRRKTDGERQTSRELDVRAGSRSALAMTPDS
jgi:hypothetical protein